MENDNKYIRQLLEKYFEGQTSLFEEEELRNYFRQDEIPESLEQYKPIFEFFSLEKEILKRDESPLILPHTSQRRWIWRISIGVAASILLLLGIKVGIPHHDPVLQSCVYINGVKYTDFSTIQSETLNTLDYFSETNDEVLSSQINMLDDFFE